MAKMHTLFRFCLLILILLVSSSFSLPEDYETVQTSNAAILNRLGMIPYNMHQQDGHHRKRLAPESFRNQPQVGRRHSMSNHDSHVYVVKLPPSPPYYSFSKPEKVDNVTVADPGFKNNGKPAKIYHWNLPLVKKINEKKKQMALLRMEQARKKMEAERERQKMTEKMNFLKKLAQEQLMGTDRKPTRNNDKWLSHPEQVEPRTKSTDHATRLKILPSSSEKMYRIDKDSDQSANGQHHFNNWHEANNLQGNHRNALESTKSKKHRKKSAISYYYAPPMTGKSASTSISKHFSGNGKPKAFYVMEKSRKPVYYHPLLP